MDDPVEGARARHGYQAREPSHNHLTAIANERAELLELSVRQ